MLSIWSGLFLLMLLLRAVENHALNHCLSFFHPLLHCIEGFSWAWEPKTQNWFNLLELFLCRSFNRLKPNLGYASHFYFYKAELWASLIPSKRWIPFVCWFSAVVWYFVVMFIEAAVHRHNMFSEANSCSAWALFLWELRFSGLTCEIASTLVLHEGRRARKRGLTGADFCKSQLSFSGSADSKQEFVLPACFLRLKLQTFQISLSLLWSLLDASQITSCCRGISFSLINTGFGHCTQNSYKQESLIRNIIEDCL